MKKKIILSMFIFLLPINVYGESIIKNKCYKEKKEYIGYLTQEENTNNYILYDSEKKEYGQWNYYNENLEISSNIEINNVYTYKTIDKIKYLFIREIDVYSVPLNISEIKIFNKDELVQYSTMCYGCEPYLMDYFNDNDLDTNVNIIRNGAVIIELDNYYYPWDIKLEIHYNNTSNEKFKIWLSQYNSSSKTPIMQYIEKFSVNKEKMTKNYIFDETMIYNFVYSEEEFSSLDIIDNWYTKLISNQKMYRNVLTKYNYYKIIKEYLDDYYDVCPKNYIKDNNDYITITNKTNNNLENKTKTENIDNNKLETIFNNKQVVNEKSISDKIISKKNNVDKKEKQNNKQSIVIEKKYSKSNVSVNNTLEKKNNGVQLKKKGINKMTILITLCLLGLSAIIIRFKL